MNSPCPPPSRRQYTLRLPTGGALHVGARCLVMGILNVTPDSFGEAVPRLRAGVPVDVGAAVDAALAMESAGADLIDIGGESTRPGATAVAAGEELARVVPVVAAVARRVRVPVSIDTYKSAVARAALDAGAALVNDVSGLQYDPALARVAAERGAPIVLTHMRGRPASMYEQARYQDLQGEVIAELRARIGEAIEAGVAVEQIVVDPGIGFAKRPEHSYGVLAGVAGLAAALDRPVLVAPSRKGFLRAGTGDRPPSERDWGTAAAVTAAVLFGAHIVRVHAVAEMVQVVRVAEEIRNHACTG